VAKTRRPAKKRGSPKSKRSKPAKKASAKAPKKRAVPVKAVRKVDLKELRKQFGSVLAILSARQGSSPDKEARLDATRRRVSQWMTDIDDICTPEEEEICGPTMDLPLP
jgi:hypothetical protein